MRRAVGGRTHDKLHHHLGLLSREKDGEELRAVYHFVKRYDSYTMHT